MAKLTKAQRAVLRRLYELCGDDDCAAFSVMFFADESNVEAMSSRLRRLAKRGLVEFSPAISRFAGSGWGITDAGRAALAEER